MEWAILHLLTAAEHHRTLTCTHFVLLRAGGWVGRVAGYIPTCYAHPKMVAHPSTNRPRRRATWLLRPMQLPLRQIQENRLHCCYDSFGVTTFSWQKHDSIFLHGCCSARQVFLSHSTSGQVFTSEPLEFVPHDAMLARYMMSSCVLLSVCHKSRVLQRWLNLASRK